MVKYITICFNRDNSGEGGFYINNDWKFNKTKLFKSLRLLL